MGALKKKLDQIDGTHESSMLCNVWSGGWLKRQNYFTPEQYFCVPHPFLPESGGIPEFQRNAPESTGIDRNAPEWAGIERNYHFPDIKLLWNTFYNLLGHLFPISAILVFQGISLKLKLI